METRTDCDNFDEIVRNKSNKTGIRHFWDIEQQINFVTSNKNLFHQNYGIVTEKLPWVTQLSSLYLV